MRHLSLVCALMLSGCGSSNPCDGVSGGICIALQVTGDVSGLDQLAVTVDNPMPKTLTTPNPPRAFTLPVSVAVVLPDGTSGTVNLTADGLAAGVVRATGSTAVALP